jgi:pimeloyl-ACP methyl ester carboxylesterase
MHRLTLGWRLRWRLVFDTSGVMVGIVMVWTLAPALLATYVPPIPVDETVPSDYGLDAVEVRFETSDEVELWGWYVAPRSGKTVVLRHGSGSTAGDVMPQAKVLVDNGYGVLATDARGHGRSQGTAMDFGWFGTEDIAAAIAYLQSQPGVDASRIAVVGMSMGGEEAIGAAGSISDIAAVVAEGATARTDDDKAWLPDRYGWRGSLQLSLERIQYWLTDLLSPARRPVSLVDSAALAAPRPILLITGGEVPDELSAAEYMRSIAGPNVAIWTVPGAGHIQGLTAAPKRWEEEVVGFLDRALGSQ